MLVQKDAFIVILQIWMSCWKRNTVQAIKGYIRIYKKNGSVEIFFEKYYGNVAANSMEFFRGLTKNAATLLALKVSDSLLVYCNEVKSTRESNKEVRYVFSDRDKSCIQYVGGYVLQNLHKKQN